MSQEKSKPTPKPPKISRDERVAAALRENLHRRKQQQQAREQSAPKEKET